LLNASPYAFRLGVVDFHGYNLSEYISQLPLIKTKIIQGILFVMFQENPNIFSVGDELKLFEGKFP
jgi:hypothetical protein